MPWSDPHDLREQQRRLEAALARASASLMSNAKWRTVFAVLRRLNVGEIRWKFVREDRIFDALVPRESAMRDEGLGDVLPSPYADFREIDWIEIPLARAAGLAEALSACGEFPVRDFEDEIRIEGYKW